MRSSGVEQLRAVAQYAQQLGGCGIRAALAGLPLGEGGLGDAQRRGKIRLIEAETAPEVGCELGCVLVGRRAGDDDGGAARRVEFYAVLEAIRQGVLGELVE